MTDYSSYFQFGGDPTLSVTGKANSDNMGMNWIDWTPKVNSGTQNTAANNSFNSIMSGIDSASSGYVNTLKNLYGQYSTNADAYSGNVKPIIDSIGTDITGMQDTNNKYSQTLADIKPTMLNGIQVDPNAANTRNQYMGAVADQNQGAQQQFNQSAESQGQNPYANTGANREFALSKAGGLSDASNKAYSDWRKNYNSDVATKAGLAGQYAGLQSNLGSMQANVVNARGTQAGLYGNILNAQNSATGAQAQGNQDLLSYEQGQKQLQLSLAAQQQNNAQRTAGLAQSLMSAYQANPNNAWGGNKWATGALSNVN